MNSPEENNTQEEQAKTAAEMLQEAQQAEATEAAGPAIDETGNDFGMVGQLQNDLQAAQAKADENWERSLRLQADMDNQRRRFEKEANDRPIDENLLAAIAHGLPECSGVAMGVDRLLMHLLQAGRISDVLSFDWSKA